MKPRKPSETAVKVRLTHSTIPDSLIASVDYHPTEREQQRLYWECEDEFWETALNLNLETIKTNMLFTHYSFYDSNPPLQAAKHAARAFQIEILTEGKTDTGKGFMIEPKDRSKLGLLAEGDIPPTLEEAKQCMKPEVRQWVEKLPPETIAHESEMLQFHTAERFARGIERYMGSCLEYEEEMRQKLADEDE